MALPQAIGSPERRLLNKRNIFDRSIQMQTGSFHSQQNLKILAFNLMLIENKQLESYKFKNIYRT